ncbi:MAG: hypothetical protein ACI9OJ_003546 [Myxococcota bacterium]|jgi:hypothetical protein
MRSWVVLFVSVPLLTFGGCFGEDANTCEYWGKQLEKNKREKEAIEKLGEMDCKEHIALLAEKFSGGSLYRRQILATAKTLGKSDKAEEIVRSALTDKEVGPLAIRMAVEWKTANIASDLSKMIRKQVNASTRLQALEALVSLNGAETALDVLIWVVGEEPTLQGVETNIYAAKQLAGIKWKEVEEEKATHAAKQLIRALFMTNAKGQSAQMDARLALRAIGPAATEPILGAFKGVNKDLNEFAEIRGLPKWKYTQGHQLVEMLWDVGDKRASPVLMEAIGIPLDPPPPDVARLSEEGQREWKMANSNRLSTTALTVGALANDDAIRFATALLKRKNPPADASQFVNAGLGLALMGTPKSREALWELFEGDDETIEKKRARVKELKDLVGKEKDEEKKKTLMKEHDGLIDDVNAIEARKANYVTNLAIGLGPEHAKKFKTAVLDVTKGPLAESSKAPIPVGYYSVVEKCGSDADCYVKLVEDRKGSYKEIPTGIQNALKTLTEESKKMKDVVKPITARVKAKKTEVKAKLDEVLALKAKIEELQKDKAALKKQEKEYKVWVTSFNDGLDVYNKLREETEAIYKERNAALEGLDKFKKGVEEAYTALYGAEKAILMLGTLPGAADKVVPLIVSVFPEADGQVFQQFRQWSVITLEHHADKDDLAGLEALLKIESQDGARTTFWSLRLKSLIERVQRS